MNIRIRIDGNEIQSAYQFSLFVCHYLMPFNNHSGTILHIGKNNQHNANLLNKLSIRNYSHSNLNNFSFNNIIDKLIEIKTLSMLILSSDFLNWKYSEECINEPLERFEHYLEENSISVLMYGKYRFEHFFDDDRELINYSELPKILKQMQQYYSNAYNGESLVLPYGFLPYFIIKEMNDKTIIKYSY